MWSSGFKFDEESDRDLPALHLVLRAVRMLILPVHYFYFFLFYTEPLSTVLLLGMVFLHLRDPGVNGKKRESEDPVNFWRDRAIYTWTAGFCGIGSTI